MGTTLTGTTPQDTYESLIKVADNGPLSATAKFLSDGEGLDSALALSTTAVGIGTAAPTAKLDVRGSAPIFRVGAVAGAFVELTDNQISAKTSAAAASDLFLNLSGANTILNRDTGNVGIGTSAPLSLLDAKVSADRHFLVNFDNTVVTIKAAADSANPEGLRLIGDGIRFNTGTTGSGTEIARFTADGLTFNGDTAAANALDDYEEGTWTMGVSFGGASVGVTFAANTGTYTKIGRQVMVNGRLDLSSKGSSTGQALLTGLPFTIANTTGNWSAASLRFNFVTFANQMQAFGLINSTTLAFTQTTEAGASSDLTDADFSTSDIMLSFTYFV